MAKAKTDNNNTQPTVSPVASKLEELRKNGKAIISADNREGLRSQLINLMNEAGGMQLSSGAIAQADNGKYVMQIIQIH